jgi:hypothetical protein
MDRAYILIAVLAAIIFLLNLIAKEKKKGGARKDYDYEAKKLMSPAEISFFEILKHIVPKQLAVLPQVNLGTIIDKKGDSKYRNELFRNIDFCIFDAEYNPILLIELNDASHERKDRKIRDEKVKAICGKAGLELLEIKAKKDFDVKDIEEKIITKINNVITKQKSVY